VGQAKLFQSLTMLMACKHCGSDKIILGGPLLDTCGRFGQMTKPQ
jgi:hypothetical protein